MLYIQRYIYLFLFLLASTSVSAQNFYCNAEAEGYVNTPFRVEFVLENADGTNFQLPKIVGAQVVGGPSTSNQMSMINGRTSKKYSLIYSLLASDPGTVTIGQASINVNGKKMYTESITVKILKSSEASKVIGGSSGDFILRMVVSDSLVFPGQQINLDYILYYNSEVQLGNVLKESNYDGFYTSRLDINTSGEKQIKINNKIYNAVAIRKVALFAQKNGVFPIEPLVLQLNVPAPNSRPRGFFGFREMNPVSVSSNGLTIVVKDIPSNPPTSYSGAIGKYIMKSSINKLKSSTDDAFVINMEIKGNGDKRMISPPSQNFGPAFEVYEPNVLSDEETVESGKFVHYKKFEYLVIPKQAGDFELKPSFSYFDLEKNNYITLQADSFSVHVTQGTRKVLESGEGIANFVPAPLKKSYGKSILKYFFTVHHYAIMLMAFLSLLGMIVYRRKLSNYENLDSETKNRLKASSVIKKHLSSAKAFLDNGDQKSFYDVVSKSLNEYLYLKFNIGLENHNDQYIGNFLQTKFPGTELSQRYTKLIQKCEMALFAGVQLNSSSEIYNEVVLLLEEIEKSK